jgi:hypothetical protein
MPAAARARARAAPDTRAQHPHRPRYGADGAQAISTIGDRACSAGNGVGDAPGAAGGLFTLGRIAGWVRASPSSGWRAF